MANDADNNIKVSYKFNLFTWLRLQVAALLGRSKPLNIVSTFEIDMPTKKTAKAVNGFKRVIVPDCPYCHKEHEHSAGSNGVRTADCGQGEYILDFSV